MARIRTIKPEFFTSEDIVKLSPLARLLYIATWCEADKEGRLQWKPGTFKLRYLPADNCDINALCAELIEAGLVVLYAADLAYIPRFARHQHINPRESASTLPSPEEVTRGDASARVTDAQVGREGKGREGISVPNGTGGEPPAEDPEDQKAKTRAELWRAGKSLLAEQGMPKGQCGSFVGKLVSDYGDDIVVEAVRAAVFAQAAEAREYLIATCQRLKGERKPTGPPLTVTSDADRKTAEYIAQQSAHAAQAVPPPPAIADLRLKLLSKGIAA